MKMKTIGKIIKDIGLKDLDAKDFVLSKRKKVYVKRTKEGYSIAFKHRFYKNDMDKLIEQEKTINKVTCLTEDQAWISSALILMGFDESLSFLEVL